MALNDTQARARFGMTQQDAHRVRDLALQSLTPAQTAAARAAWADMAADVRASQHHPELIRFRMLSAIAAGAPVADAAADARDFANS